MKEGKLVVIQGYKSKTHVSKSLHKDSQSTNGSSNMFEYQEHLLLMKLLNALCKWKPFK